MSEKNNAAAIKPPVAKAPETSKPTIATEPRPIAMGQQSPRDVRGGQLGV